MRCVRCEGVCVCVCVCGGVRCEGVCVCEGGCAYNIQVDIRTDIPLDMANDHTHTHTLHSNAPIDPPQTSRTKEVQPATPSRQGADREQHSRHSTRPPTANTEAVRGRQSLRYNRAGITVEFKNNGIKCIHGTGGS